MATSDHPDAQVGEAGLSGAEDRRGREDAEDRVVALPRLQQYRDGRVKLIKHEDLMRKLGIELE